ncbi:hypothetical protein E2C01_057808 [Portunus trituberculatus]|uniref:Uncharacterized protein n=1 Tax=Portunus trituberculatus TaxID=210409 RepID=A0A5B7H1H4_PORTR|nr:hypothetical protein [Portunus trituberculatus]
MYLVTSVALVPAPGEVGEGPRHCFFANSPHQPSPASQPGFVDTRSYNKCLGYMRNKNYTSGVKLFPILVI